MSRIGLEPITVPAGVEVSITNEQVTVKGPKGELSTKLLAGIKVIKNDNELLVERENDKKKTKSFHGLIRSLIHNNIVGVTDGFSKKLEVNGVGYRANVSGKSLNLKLGFSHDINFPLPDEVEAKVDGNVIEISGSDKALVGQVAANIRSLRKPEPYKGKGIKYIDEVILRKAGKTAGA